MSKYRKVQISSLKGILELVCWQLQRAHLFCKWSFSYTARLKQYFVICRGLCSRSASHCLSWFQFSQYHPYFQYRMPKWLLLSPSEVYSCLFNISKVLHNSFLSIYVETYPHPIAGYHTQWYPTLDCLLKKVVPKLEVERLYISEFISNIPCFSENSHHWI